MKIFYVDGVDWWVGESIESVQNALHDPPHTMFDDLEDVRELTGEELDTLIFTDTQEDDTPILESARNFREQLETEIKAGGEFPRLFATSEY